MIQESKPHSQSEGLSLSCVLLSNFCEITLRHIVQSFLGKSNSLELKGTVKEPVSNITCLLDNTCPDLAYHILTFIVLLKMEKKKKKVLQSNLDQMQRVALFVKCSCTLQVGPILPFYVANLCHRLSELNFWRRRKTVTCFCMGNVQENLSLAVKSVDKEKDLKQPHQRRP